MPTNRRMMAQPESGVARRRPFGRLLALCVAVIIVLEAFVFNMPFWCSLGNTPVEALGEPVTLTAESPTVRIEGPVEVRSMSLSFATEDDGSRRIVTLDVSAADEGSSEGYGLGSVQMCPAVPASCSFSVSLYGQAEWIDLTVELAEGQELAVEGVTLNPRMPFEVSALRVGLMALVAAAVVAFRAFDLFNRSIGKSAALFRRVVVAVVAVSLALSTALFVSKPLYTSVATSFYNAEYWTGNALANSFSFDTINDERYKVDRYYELARSLAEGRFDLLVDPPSWLSEIGNPYDNSQREEAVAQTGEEFLWDVAYYDGRYYLYFGIVPALVFYLPFYLITGASFPCGVAILLSCLAFQVGVASLVSVFARARFPRMSVGAGGLVCAGALASALLPIVLLHATVYMLPIMMGAAFAVWGLRAYAQVALRAASPAVLLAGSLSMALVLGCRPQLGILSLAVIPAVAVSLRGGRDARRIPRSGRDAAVCLACAIAPFLVIGVLLGAYNAARFGSPFDFGANYNLTTNDMTLRPALTVGALLEGAFAYLFQPPNVVASFPFLLPAGQASSHVGLTIAEPVFGGAFAVLPFLWVIPLVLRRARENRAAVAVVGGLVACAVVVALFDAAAAGILERYFLDFCFMLGLAAAYEWMHLCANGRELLVPGWISRGALVAACAASAGYLLLLVLTMFGYESGATSGYLQHDPTVWALLKSTFQFWS